MSDIYQLIYVSSSQQLMDEQTLASLLTDFKQANDKHGITGMLLYKDGDIMQVIEGAKENILQLIENIKLDKRHSSMIILWQGEVPNREFGNWSMSYKDISSSNVDGFSSFLSSGQLDPETMNSIGRKAKRLLLSFRG